MLGAYFKLKLSAEAVAEIVEASGEAEEASDDTEASCEADTGAEADTDQEQGPRTWEEHCQGELVAVESPGEDEGRVEEVVEAPESVEVEVVEDRTGDKA